jgi:cell division protein FtsX
MDERLQRQLVRQLRILNVWMTFLSLMVIATLVIMGYVAFKVVTFVHDTTQKIDNVQTQVKSNLDFKQKLCSSNNAATSRLSSNICE